MVDRSDLNLQVVQLLRSVHLEILPGITVSLNPDAH